MNKHKKNKASGITILSLVVTVIVLLILAGISITMLSGDNGIIKRAVNAKKNTQKEETREIIESEVLKSYNKLGDLSLNELKQKLFKLNADVSQIENILIDNAQTGKISLNGYDFFVDENYNVLDYTGPYKTDIPQVSKENAFSRLYGRIDIVFLNGTGYNISAIPNTPQLDNTMVPVYFDESNLVWKVCSKDDTDKWYNYEPEDIHYAGTTKGDTHKNRWANVMLTDLIQVKKDEIIYDTEMIKTKLTENKLNDLVGSTVITEGSMLVWIPRYAYKITYYSEANKKTIIGYSDSRGFVDKEGKTPKDMQEPVTAINVNGILGDNEYNYYRAHPAFENDLSQGGWSSRITGIWVGKFEATGTINEVTTLANASTLKNQKNGTMWNSLKNNFMAKTTESHMIKNSEWGACAYIAESKFGRNEANIIQNQNESYYTADGDYKNNQNQSTTGNIYGIYDTVGGLYEYVASYIPNKRSKNGNQFASLDNTTNNKLDSTPYATVYQYNNTSDTGSNNYKINLNKRFGDAIFETTSWYSTGATFASATNPFFVRGGDYDCNNAGIFYFLHNYGATYIKEINGSRIVCIVK